MSLVWQCDRCRTVSGAGDADDPPEDWQQMVMPCRGSQGAKSRQMVTLCADCDDGLYRWLVD
jgi:hypothetical protein